jgi:hypothetical protein
MESGTGSRGRAERGRATDGRGGGGRPLGPRGAPVGGAAGRVRASAGGAVGRACVRVVRVWEGCKRFLYICAFDPTALIHRGFIQRLGYVGPHSAGPNSGW